MSKPAPLSSMAGEFAAGLVSKGAAAPVTAAPAIAATIGHMPPPAAEISEPAPARSTRSAGRLRGRLFELPMPVPAPAPPARVQVGLRLTAERHDQLRRIVRQTGVSVQGVIEQVLNEWMDEFERAGGGNSHG